MVTPPMPPKDEGPPCTIELWGGERVTFKRDGDGRAFWSLVDDYDAALAEEIRVAWADWPFRFKTDADKETALAREAKLLAALKTATVPLSPKAEELHGKLSAPSAE